MTDLEISKALALAIGWKPEQIVHYKLDHGHGVMEFINVLVKGLNYGRTFDYRDWNVIGPIAERYDCFPARIPASAGFTASTLNGKVVCADTPQKAIALAVIGAKK